MKLGLWIGAAIGAVALYVLSHVWAALKSPLRSIPGPWIARFSDIWYFAAVQRRGQTFQETSKRLHHQHGPIVRYGPRRFSFNDPEAAKIIYSHTRQFPKSSWYDAWRRPEGHNSFADRDIKRHASERKLFQSTYSLSSLVAYEPHVNLCGDLLTQRLDELIGQSPHRAGAVLNLGHWLQCYAFDVISSITYGRRWGFLDAGEDVDGLMAALDSRNYYAFVVGIYASLHPYLLPLRNRWMAWRGAGDVDALIGFTQRQMAVLQEGEEADYNEESSGLGREPSFLAKFCRRHLEKPDAMPMASLVSMCLVNMAAGSDTTGISLSACIFYLLKNPGCLDHLRAEVDAAAQDNPDHLPFNVTQNMPYLQAVIKEALRLHPAVAMPLERVVPQGGATIADKFFPEGTIVGVNPWVQHRNRAVFGQDADEFNPSRWLSEDKERVALMTRSWMPFGMGTRTCIGRHISHLEISKLVPRLVRDFDFSLAGGLEQPGATWRMDNGWFAKQRGFMVAVKRRQR
ncbi:cytochrome P450 [Microdochium trichocladiopsis]|uniref:Cytochrome P450 n=1 Tax=Microdochium trichocladiopsis TaxID=1682393 RepID=A0A9P9BFY5_9PEZI|nr:cytochrome P450 [Microdochium trichocladiopsis]KAH7014099.1 cytochrome P450 [Microdochium trichocladiopsis]